MKKELAALELHYILEELKPLIDSKLDQIYQFDAENFIFQFHKTGIGKIMLRITPKLAYIASKKENAPERIMSACEFLRKKLLQARVRDIKQLGFERILNISLDVKEEQIVKYELYIELFDRGNIILCNQDNTIIFARIQHEFKDRKIHVKESYIHPKKEVDFIELKKNDLKQVFDGSLPVVKALATRIGLGGLYSEEACLRANIDKSKTSLSEKELSSLFNSLQELKSEKLDPSIVLENSSGIEAVPFKLLFYKGKEYRKLESFSSGIELMSTIAIPKSSSLKEADKIRNIIAKQNDEIALLEKDAIESNRKAELLYQHYNELQELLKQINELKKRISWDELKKKLKSSGIIKEIREKEGKIVVNLE